MLLLPGGIKSRSLTSSDAGFPVCEPRVRKYLISVNPPIALLGSIIITSITFSPP